jgi:hypothetical protein
MGTERRNSINNTRTLTIYCELIYVTADTSNSFGFPYQQQCPTGKRNLEQSEPNHIGAILQIKNMKNRKANGLQAYILIHCLQVKILLYLTTKSHFKKA